MRSGLSHRSVCGALHGAHLPLFGARHGVIQLPGICNDRARFATKMGIWARRNERRRLRLRDRKCCFRSTYHRYEKYPRLGSNQ